MTNPRYNKEWAAEYYIKNKERITARNKLWQEANRDKMAAYNKKHKQESNPAFSEWSYNTYPKAIWTSARRNAQDKGLPFDIEISDIVIPEKCPYLEIPLTRIRGGGRKSTNASIDKIVPSLGYVKGNIQIISEKANRMKQDASLEELKLFAQNIMRLHP